MQFVLLVQNMQKWTRSEKQSNVRRLEQLRFKAIDGQKQNLIRKCENESGFFNDYSADDGK